MSYRNYIFIVVLFLAEIHTSKWKIVTYLRPNDDLPSTLTFHQVAETRSSHDRPVDANMASREHYLQYSVRIFDWTIYLLLDEQLKLMGGRRLGPFFRVIYTGGLGETITAA